MKLITIKFLILFLLLNYSYSVHSQTLKGEKQLDYLWQGDDYIPIFKIRSDKGLQADKTMKKVQKKGFNILAEVSYRNKLTSLFYTKAKLDGNLVITTPYFEREMDKHNRKSYGSHAGISYYMNGNKLVVVVYSEYLDNYYNNLECSSCNTSVLSLDLKGDNKPEFRFLLFVDPDKKHKNKKDIIVHFKEEELEEHDIIYRFENLNGLYIYHFDLEELSKYTELSERINLNFIYDFYLYSHDNKYKFEDYSFNPISLKHFYGWSDEIELLSSEGVEIKLSSEIVEKSKSIKEAYVVDPNSHINKLILPDNIKVKPSFYKLITKEGPVYLHFETDGKLRVVFESSRKYPLAHSSTLLRSNNQYYKEYQSIGTYYKSLTKLHLTLFADLTMDLDLDKDGLVIGIGDIMEEFDITNNPCYGPCDNNSYSTYFHDNGDVYEGQWKNGQRHGEGIYIGDHGKWKYKGNWENGLKHGSGQYAKIDALWGTFNYSKGVWIENVYQDPLDNLYECYSYINESEWKKRGLGIVERSVDITCVDEQGDSIIERAEDVGSYKKGYYLYHHTNPTRYLGTDRDKAARVVCNCDN